MFNVSLAQLTADFTYTFKNGGCSLNWAPDTVYFTNTSAGAISYRWELINEWITSTDTNPNFEMSYASLVELTAYGTSGDSTKKIKAILIDKVPESMGIDILSDNCLGEPVYFSSISNTTNADFLWNFGDGNTSNLWNPQHTYSIADTYLVTLTVSNHCGIAYDTAIHITSNTFNPIANFSASVLTACPNTPIKFNNANEDKNYLHTWSFGDSNLSQQINPKHSYKNIGNYKVLLTSTNLCGQDTISKIIQIKDSIPFNTSFTSSYSSHHVCPGLPVDYTVGSFSNNIKNVIISFGDGDSSAQITGYHIFQDTGVYKLMAVSEDYCGSMDKDSFTIIVNNTGIPANAGFSWEAGCPGTPVYFQGPSDDLVDVLWIFGDGDSSSELNPVHLYDGNGPYIVKLQVTNICGNFDQETQVIMFDPNIIPNNPPIIASPDVLNGICLGTDILFSFGHSIDSTHQFIWYFRDGDTSIDFNPKHTYANSGDYPIYYIVKNKCGNTAYGYPVVASVRENIRTEASISISNSFPCIGEEVEFIDQSIPSSSSQSIWSMGDGNIVYTDEDNYSSIMLYTYDSIGSFIVKLFIPSTAGCNADTAEIEIVVSGSKADFAIISACENEIINFINLSSNDPDNFAWNFGDGSISDQLEPKHKYITSGFYDVILTVNKDGCVNSINKKIFAADSSAAVADYGYDITGATVNFFDSSDNTDSWLWDFGDGNTSSEKNPSHTYTQNGSYIVILTASNACGFSNQKQYTIDIVTAEVFNFGRKIDELAIYPNPVKNNLVIDLLSEEVKVKNVYILDLLGKKIMQLNTSEKETKMNIDLSVLGKGIYFLLLETRDEKLYYKIVKQ